MNLDQGFQPRYPESIVNLMGVTRMNAGDIPTWQRPAPVEEHRTNIVKVRLTDSELNLIKEKNPQLIPFI